MKQQVISIFFLSVILTSALGLGLLNLNYNSPFNDEAIYIVLGRMGIFQWDWWSYNSLAWMPGLPYIYPVMSGIAYFSGGIVGSRLLSVIFGVLAVETVFIVTTLLNKKRDGSELLPGLLAAGILGGAPVFLYVSRLATFDMPSFYFFLLSLSLLLHAFKDSEKSGKWYFLASITLLISFLIKIIIGIYIPLIVIYSFIMSRRVSSKSFYFWKAYFLVPVVAVLVLYAIGNIPFLKTYGSVQASRDKDNLQVIFGKIWENTSFVWIFYILGSLGMFIFREWKKWLYLSIGVGWILLSHIVSQRRFTLEKHTFIAVIFIAIIGGLGIGQLVNKIKSKVVRTAASLILMFSFIFYWGVAYKDAQKYNQMWQNASELLLELPKHVKSGDKVLAEVGAAAILASYEINLPTNTTTFDWFEYKNQNGVGAYTNAIADGYFDVIELDGENSPKDPANVRMHVQLKEFVDMKYSLVYSKNDFEIYKKSK
jgi:4-amino-4-deoxy-L-arabinose transferase-like glycosyltransferase